MDERRDDSQESRADTNYVGINRNEGMEKAVRRG